MADNLVKFRSGTAAEFAALEAKDENTLYFISDVRKVFKGSTPYGGGFYTTVTELPSVGELNTLYFNTTDNSLSYYNGTDFTTIGQAAAVDDLTRKVAIIQGDENTDGSIKKALADAKAYADTQASAAQSAAETTAATANTELETKLQGEIDKKADSATTLGGYGIDIPQARTDLDVYTKGETDTKISSAVANAHHLKRSIVDALPAVGDADEDTIYMVPQNGATQGSETSAYDEFMIVNGAFERIGTSSVDLTDYVKSDDINTRIATAKTEAINTASTDATSKANGALSDAKAYADGLAKNYDAAGAADTAEKNAKNYADGLAGNYATADQGKKADTALQGVVAGANISVVTSDVSDATVSATNPKISVSGLGSAAFKAEGDFATAAQGKKADSAVQSVTASDATTGTDGTFVVDGKEVAVKGLKSAAYTEAAAYATAAQGTNADTAVEHLTWGAISE